MSNRFLLVPRSLSLGFSSEFYFHVSQTIKFLSWFGALGLSPSAQPLLPMTLCPLALTLCPVLSKFPFL